MSVTAPGPEAEVVPPVPSAEFEVATLSADTLRASIRVTGELRPTSAAVLTSVLSTHVAAGRRYLRVDLATAEVSDPAVLEGLVTMDRAIFEIGGMLVFENADPLVVEAIRDVDLFVQPND